MSNQLPEKKTRNPVTDRPLQRIPWDQKIADKKEWFKTNADYYIGLSNFNPSTQSNGKRDLGMLYQVYNNKFPLDWFKHITDPLNAVKTEHKNYPAKIRPTGMLRTNIDLLLGEYPKRPFVYQVVNMGEDGYNSFLEGLSGEIKKNLEEHFMAIAQQSMSAAGHSFQQIPQDQDIELPESVKERFTGSYKDNLARRAQKWVKRAIREYHVRQKMLEMFKDWLIVGESYSYKNIENGNFVYDRVSPLELSFDKSDNTKLVEDGEWAVRRMQITLSDAVDRFYDELKDSELTELETKSFYESPQVLFTALQNTYSNRSTLGRIPVYHVTWKGKKLIKYISYTDPLTGQTQEMVVDESTPMDGSMKLLKKEWVNEVYESWRLGDDIYCKSQALQVQRNEMNNFSTCKLPYNGRKFSNTHAENISVLEMGVPYAILYMIINYQLEKTLAKNKGKIALIDQNAIPQKNGWDDEKFFYYTDALGYMIINRNQAGVDKSWNQYHVLDMSLWDQIKNLIELRDSCKKDWDDQLGINPQRKAQIGSGDGLGTTQAALFQSSVITDMIYTLFEEFTEADLQGMLDYSRFINVDGIRGIYNNDDFDQDLLSLDPNSYCNAELGLFITHSASEMQTLQAYKNQIQAMVQNGVKQSTILEIQQADNVSELMMKLKSLEAIELEQAMQGQQSEQAMEMAKEEIKEKFIRLESMMKREEINVEWDRKDQNEMIKGEYGLYEFGGDGDNNDNGIPDATEISKRVIATQKVLSDERMKTAEISQKDKIHKDTMDLEDKKLTLARQQMESKERTEKLKAKTALKNKVVGQK